MRPVTKLRRTWMVLILLLAALLRLAQLPELPLGLHYDEAANLIITRQIADAGYRPLFIQAYTGKEVLFFYAAAPWVHMTGGATWGLRLAAAMIGILTVAATFAAVRAMFTSRQDTQTLALLAAGWMALAFPHVLLSRYGFRAVIQPLLQALTLAALWRGLRSGRASWLGAAGLCLGLTGYTYLAARLFPLPLGLVMLWLLIRTPATDRPRRLRQLGLTFAVALAVFAPLGFLFLRQPSAFTTRISQVAATSWSQALRGIGLCLRALVWPKGGDPYIRFNQPGRPILDMLSALLALVGLVHWMRSRSTDTLTRAAGLMTLTGLGAMLLPSALATGEITPSNLRLVGLYPFLAILPALGGTSLLRGLPRRWQSLTVLVLLGIGSAHTAICYREWASSAALFRAADGAMVLAAQALDAEAAPDTTVYLASLHYRHPTVAALAERYPQAKWLTGGETLVLPPEGDAVYLIPDDLLPPSPWPETLTQAWQTEVHRGPVSDVTLTIHRLSAMQIGALRAQYVGPQPPAADFAHVVRVYDAYPAGTCRVAAPCPILLIWEPQAIYPGAVPVVRLWHPATGEWDRVLPFHYPAEQWTPGDLVLDQYVLTPPVGTPVGEGYRLGIGVYDTAAQRGLPRLRDERFAGLELVLPDDPEGLALAPMDSPPTPSQIAAACRGIDRSMPQEIGTLTLLGWHVETSEPLLPGSALWTRLCWQARTAGPANQRLTLRLEGPSREILYQGLPAGKTADPVWRPSEILEDRYRLRISKTLPAGEYTVILQVGDGPPLTLHDLTVTGLARSFTPPAISTPLDITFTDAEGKPKLRLLGYKLDTLPDSRAWEITLFWQVIAEVEDDYVVFLHLLDPQEEQVIAQVDEGPRQGAYPTSLWMEGEVIADSHRLPWPQELDGSSAQGCMYPLRVGLYIPWTGEHLLVAGEPQASLPDITVEK